MKIYNCAVVYTRDAFHMVFRAMGRDAVSRLGYATSADGVHFQTDPAAVVVPSETWDAKGCEDPRMTVVGDTVYLTYTAFDGQNARVVLATSADFRHWTKTRPLFPKWNKGSWPTWPVDVKNWTKGGGIFPHVMRGENWMLFGDDQIWLARSADLRNWRPLSRAILSPRTGYFDAGYLEVGPPPIETEDGWLVLYHGVDRKHDTADEQRVYRLGVALLDAQDPRKVVGRCAEPVLEPLESYETSGVVDAGYIDRLIAEHGTAFDRFWQWPSSPPEAGPTAIFCCGAVSRGRQVNVYYGAMDRTICLATASVDSLLRQLN